ncbi:SNF2 family domain-containing protein [Colletotrichum graminicola]|uniref:SNF2 family domain-containing protein n=1 Tax=Colletotrichum graminicola (strain M1.001 / M2 / FGSC 10212) TaxID=645133 RepID=E3QN72_COLGM|nr:SNF2 family domain-containing protein [Colletotrichum graminicola M1.001]EFQ32310.1 SNF2 family domain-containing protein [Colletotrichum graminicola M1.001]WDK19889.1 SNF2 family domain-containing protein [Colletotrichum graminicola]
MTRPAKQDTIVISDDETASEIDGFQPQSKKSLGKRKIDVGFEEKEVWDADSDLELPKSKKRKGQRATARNGQKSKPKGRSPKKSAVVRVDVDESDGLDDLDVAEAPDYLKERRKAFEKNRERLKEAGLLLPPDYSDVVFSEHDRLNMLERRPNFDESTKIKPCRPYQDVELEYSAGIIPAPIAQYLRDYQIVGVKFLHRLFVYQRGGVLGDDMGLGKTVQVVTFLTAAFGKTADERDRKRLKKIRDISGRWYPRILIICPGSIIENWKNELNRWGWWKVDVFHGAGKEDVLSTAKAGRTEIMITTYTTYKNHKSLVNTVKWDAVIADECHQMKERSSEVTKAMNDINALCRIGLTGTAIQNKYEELWTLLNWTNPGHFGTLSEWNNTITKPLTRGQSHDATLGQLRDARITARKLVTNLLPGFFLRRMKTLIAHQLPKKSDRVVFCPLTDQQREAYKNFISRPDVELLRTLSDPCECGSGTGQGWCCRKTLEDGTSWQSIIFPCVTTLQKLSNHLTLLIPAGGGDQDDKYKREIRALQTCCPETWQYLYQNRDAILNLANPEFCGKWKVLKKLLKFWHDSGDKVLVFSHSVRLLRILQHLFHNTSYSVTYLDGSVSYEDRQKAVDDFNSDPTQFVFLISTKAGGVGLNITSANKVVIVDPHWNPSYDLQAQDRAYRIGQVRDVDVFRLVSTGTIEEIVYARQIYKQQQANIGYTASSERRYFKGVQQDSERKGEIFGLENLFTYRENQLVIRDIVNKTNIAEAKAGTGIAMTTVDMEKLAKEEEHEGELGALKRDPAGSEDGDMSQLAAFLAGKNTKAGDSAKTQQAKSDAVQAILSAAGVEYTHENSEVIGTSKVEEQLSRKAEMAASSDVDGEGDSALFADSQAFDAQAQKLKGFSYVYNPPEDVMRRQFCSMAREFGFATAIEFALVVGSWTQAQRRNCLDAFYKIREGKLLAEETVKAETEAEQAAAAAVKEEVQKPEGGFKNEPETKVEETKDSLVIVDNDAETEEEDEDEAGIVHTQKDVVNQGPAETSEAIKSEKEAVKPEIEADQKRTSVFIYDTDDTDEL